MATNVENDHTTVLLHHFLEMLQDRLNVLTDNDDRAMRQLNALEYQLFDLRAGLARGFGPFPAVELRTAHPVAVDSLDHLNPVGAVQDNTRHPRFFRACERHFGRAIRYLDLGCSGGGLVFDALLRGHHAVGLEGSDAPLKAQRAEWRTIPAHLFTCDIRKPFGIFEKETGAAVRFDVISLWEVIEHIDESDLPQLFANVHAHLAAGGIFVGSVSTVPEILANGVDLHRTVRPRDWWAAVFRAGGFEDGPDSVFEFADFARGSGNGARDPHYGQMPQNGFHFVLTGTGIPRCSV